jgi:hypothetical protein
MITYKVAIFWEKNDDDPCLEPFGVMPFAEYFSQ